jgi:hypothetical protein
MENAIVFLREFYRWYFLKYLAKKGINVIMERGKYIFF